MSLIPFAGAVQKFNRPRDTGYRIERSLRFNSADSAYLNRTPSGAGTSATIWTFSWWQKGVALTGSTQVVFGAESGGARDMIRWDGNGSLEFVKATSTLVRVPTAKYRDPSAWYHFIINVSGATVGVYVNGVQVTAFSTSNNPSGSWLIGQANLHRIGLDPTGGDALNGYLTEINFIDGQALDETDFGEFNSDTGVWQPKAYTGSYGTNGFYLNFSDNASTTTLGDDFSGNGNDWTTNNFSVTAGAGNDSLVDSPTRYGTDTGAGGEVRGNYATLNSVSPLASGTISNGNLSFSTGNADAIAVGTIGVSSGKWYWEVTATTVSAANACIGIIGQPPASLTVDLRTASNGYGYLNNGNKGNNNSTSAYGATYTSGDVIGVALDLDAGTLVFYKNNSSQGTAYSSLSGTFTPAMSDLASASGGTVFDCNFGQRPFEYTAPSGFKALVTTNLPTPTIEDGGEYFNTVLYTGNGTTNNITVGFQPDLTWFKLRSAVENHNWRDAVRGSDKYLRSDQTNAEATAADVSFTSDGFTVTGTSPEVNVSSGSYVAWNWKAGNSNVTNTDGTITSTVRANPTAGFSIVTFSGASAGTVGHGLGIVPSMIIIKTRTQTLGWYVYTSTIGASGWLQLNTTAAAITGNSAAFGGTNPTSTVFSYGSGLAGTGDYVAYCFAPVAGYSAFGSYTGNGSADGVFVYLGFRPRYVLLKASSTTGDWQIFDTARNTYNIMNLRLDANASDAESTAANLDTVSNGFKLRTTSAAVNGSGVTMIYAAWAENPFQYALAR